MGTTLSALALGLQSVRQCWTTSPANISVPQLEPMHCIHTFRASYAAHLSDLQPTNHGATQRTLKPFFHNKETTPSITVLRYYIHIIHIH